MADPSAAEPRLLLSLLGLGALALSAKFCVRGLRAPSREVATFVACFAAQVVYEQWLLVAFPAPVLLACVRVGASTLATGLVAGAGSVVAAAAAAAAATGPGAGGKAAASSAAAASAAAADGPLSLRAWAGLGALGVLWGVTEVLAAFSPPSTVAAVEGSLGLILALLFRVAAALRRRRPFPDSLVVAVGAPLCCLGSLLALPFDADAFGIVAGVLRGLSLCLVEEWLVQTAARRRWGTRLFMIFGGAVCFLTAALLFFALELPHLLTRRLMHPLEFAGLVVPSVLLSYGATASSLEFVRVSSALGLLCAVAVANACLVAFLAFAPAVRPVLAASIFGTTFGVLGCIVVARNDRGSVEAAAALSGAVWEGVGSKPVEAGGSGGDADLGDDAEWLREGEAAGGGAGAEQRQHLSLRTNAKRGGADAADAAAADDALFFSALGAAALSAAPELDETAWLLRGDEEDEDEAVLIDRP